MIIFLRPYDNLPIYGGLNKSKSTFLWVLPNQNPTIRTTSTTFIIRNYR